MVIYVRPYRNKFIGVLIALFFSGPGVMFYIHFWRGVFTSIVEIYMMIVFGPIVGFLMGSLIAVALSWPKLKEYEERYKRIEAYRKVQDITPEEMEHIDKKIYADMVIIITNIEGLRRIWKSLPKNNVLFLKPQ